MKKFKVFSLSCYNIIITTQIFPLPFYLLNTYSFRLTHLLILRVSRKPMPYALLRAYVFRLDAEMLPPSASLLFLFTHWQLPPPLTVQKRNAFPFRTGGKELKNIFSLRPKQCSISFPHYQGQVRNKFLMAGYFQAASKS